MAADGDGRFKATHLAEGTYEVWARESGGRGDSKVILAQAGTADIVATVQTTVEVWGRVRTSAGVPPVFYVDGSRATDAGGVFMHAYLRTASVTLSLWAPGYAEVRRDLGDLTEVDVLELPEITLPRGSDLHGRVVERGTHAGVLASVFACPDPLAISPSCATTTDENGVFTLSAVRRDVPLIVSLSRKRELHDIRVVVAPGEGPVLLEMEPGQKIRGRVVDETGRGIARTFISATLPEKRASARSVTSDRGLFEFRHLGDGRWTLRSGDGVRVVDVAGRDVSDIVIESRDELYE